MEYLRQALDVSLAQFAATGGMTETEYSRKLFEKLETGNLMDLLNIDAQVRLGDWISEKYLDGAHFSVVFRLSMNRVRDVALHCVCAMDMMQDEPKIFCKFALPGFIDAPPKELAGLEVFELGFEDMEPRV